MAGDAVKTQIRQKLYGLGFDAVGFVKPSAIKPAGSDLKAFLEAGYQGTMGWMADRVEWRADPAALWPEARTIIVAAMNYGPSASPLEILEDRSKGAISVYAQNKDYHDVLKKRLKQVARWLHQDQGAEVKVFVDTAPVMGKTLGPGGRSGLARKAHQSGLQGIWVLVVSRVYFYHARCLRRHAGIQIIAGPVQHALMCARPRRSPPLISWTPGGASPI